MRGRALYFYALKEDIIDRIRELEEKLGGLQYVYSRVYKEPKLKIYNSIDEMPDIGVVKPYRDRYMIALKSDRFSIETVELSEEIREVEGDYNYFAKDEKGGVYFVPSGIYKGTEDCVIKGEINTVSEDETRQTIFKELKKSLLKNMMLTRKGDITYVGKSIIENKEKYRLLYGGIKSNPDYDLDISEAVWKEKGRNKRLSDNSKNKPWNWENSRGRINKGITGRVKNRRKI